MPKSLGAFAREPTGAAWGALGNTGSTAYPNSEARIAAIFCDVAPSP